MWVIETDALCKHCEDPHGYATNMCTLVVFSDYATARWVADAIEGAEIRPIQEVPPGIDYHLYLHKGGRSDPAYPQTVHSLPRR